MFAAMAEVRSQFGSRMVAWYGDRFRTDLHVRGNGSTATAWETAHRIARALFGCVCDPHGTNMIPRNHHVSMGVWFFWVFFFAWLTT